MNRIVGYTPETLKDHDEHEYPKVRQGGPLLNTFNQNTAAAALILLVLAGLALHLWGDGRASHYHGPVHLAIDQRTVLVGDSAGLVELDVHNGEVLTQTAFADLSVPTPLADIQRLDNGDVLLAESETASVWRCNLERTTCERFADLDKVAGRFLKIHYDESAQRLWVAATHGHRIWRLTPPFDRAHAQVMVDGLAAPNEIWLSPQHTLWVSNTDAGAVQAFRADGDRYVRTGRELDGHTAFTSKRLPLDFAGNERDGWWVLVSDLAYIAKDLIAYDADGTPRQLIDLPVGAGPVAVEAHAMNAFVADIDGFTLYRVAADGSIKVFGDATYRQRMQQLRADHDRYRMASWVGLAVLGVGLIGVLVVAIRAKIAMREAATHRPEPAPLVVEMGVYWLRPKPRLARMQKQMMVLALLLPLLPIFGLLAVSGDVRDLLCSPELRPWLLGMIVLPLPLIVLIRRMLPQLGSDGQRLYVRHGTRPASSAALVDVRYNERVLWIGDEFVTLRDGRGRAIYEPAHLHQHVETLLPSANRVGQWQMALAMLRHGNPESWVILLLILGMLLFTVTGH